MACIATWPFSLQGVKVAAELLGKGGNCVDATEASINGKCSMVFKHTIEAHKIYKEYIVSKNYYLVHMYV